VEVASKEFMDNLVSILRMPGLNTDVKTKILRLTQNWAMSFEGRHDLRYVPEIYKELQADGS
jgi:growth factor-regulated tyrosine kinase substrate